VKAKVLFVYNVPSGGMETLNRTRSIALTEQGVQCYQLYQMTGSGVQNNPGLPLYTTDSDTDIRTILRERFNLVVVTSAYPMLERLRALGYSGPAVFEAQGLGQRQQATDILRWAKPYVDAHAQGVLYPRTKHLIELFHTVYPNKRKFCFPNPIDTKRFGYRKLERRPGPILAWVGRLEGNKNWRDFILTAIELRRHIPSLKLWMFTDPSIYWEQDKREFEHLVHSHGLASCLTKYENIPHAQMKDYLSMVGDSGGFLCSTSILEGFGYAVAEAMLCRCPVLSSRSDGVDMFIRHNDTGKFYHATQVAEAVSQGLEYLRNGALREQIRNNGQRHIMKAFSTNAYVQHFKLMLQNLMI
jgi:glycosyltransferase involved in cell wall biosynthesis